MQNIGGAMFSRLKGLFGGSDQGGMIDFTPRLPEVDEIPDIEERFSHARRIASGQEKGDRPANSRRVVLVTPGRMLMEQECPPPGSATPDMMAAIEKIAPSTT